MARLPKVMILQFQPELTHSVWVDFEHRCRSMASLIRLLRFMVEKGDAIGYRLIDVREQHLGITWKLKRKQTRCKTCSNRIKKTDTSCRHCGATDFET